MSDILRKRYVCIPDHTFRTLIDLIEHLISYSPDIDSPIKEGMINCLHDIIGEVDYEIESSC